MSTRSQLQAATAVALKAWLKGRGVRGYSRLRKEGLLHLVADMRGLESEETLVPIVTNGLKYPELTQHQIATKVKTWFYVCARRAKNT